MNDSLLHFGPNDICSEMADEIPSVDMSHTMPLSQNVTGFLIVFIGVLFPFLQICAPYKGPVSISHRTSYKISRSIEDAGLLFTIFNRSKIQQDSWQHSYRAACEISFEGFNIRIQWAQDLMISQLQYRILKRHSSFMILWSYPFYAVAHFVPWYIQFRICETPISDCWEQNNQQQTCPYDDAVTCIHFTSYWAYAWSSVPLMRGFLFSLLLVCSRCRENRPVAGDFDALSAMWRHCNEHTCLWRYSFLVLSSFGWCIA